MRTLGILLLLCAVASADSPRQRAEKLFEDGRAYLAKKEYALACTAFEQSQEADPAIGTALNIALCYEQWGHVASAYRAYQAAVKLAADKKDKRGKTAQKKVDELAPQVPHLRIEIPADADPSAIFLFDDKAVDRAQLNDEMLVDAGSHKLEVRVPGQPPKAQTIDIKNGDRKKLDVVVPKPVVKVAPVTQIVTKRSKGKLYGGIVFVGGGAVAMGLAGLFSLQARSDYAEAVRDCPDGVCRTRAAYDATQSARNKATYMSFVAGAGVALAGVGLYMIMTSKTETRVLATPVVSENMIGISIRGTL